jgi:uncharacterized membrane protein YgcG
VPPPIGGGRAGIRSVTNPPLNFTSGSGVGIQSVDGDISTTMPPTSTLPPSGIWQPPQIPTLVGEKQLVSPYTYAPIVIEASLSFKTLTPDWALTNRVALENTIKATLGLSAYEEVKVTRVMSLAMNQGSAAGYGFGATGAGGSSFGSSRDDGASSSGSSTELLDDTGGQLPSGRRGLFELFVNRADRKAVTYVRTPMLRGSANEQRLRKLVTEDTSAQIRANRKLRKLEQDPGVHVDYLVGIRSKGREAMMTGNMARMGQGDLALTSAFLMTLDQQLVMQGRPRQNLKTIDVGFSAPRVKTINDLTTPQPTLFSSGFGTTTTTTTTLKPKTLMGALSAMGNVDTGKLAKNPMFLGGAGVVFLLLSAYFWRKLRAPGRDTGSYGSSTTASDRYSPKGGGDLKLKQYRSQSAPYKNRIDDSWAVSDVSRDRSRGRSGGRGGKRKKRTSSSESESSRSSSRSSSSGGSSSS